MANNPVLQNPLATLTALTAITAVYIAWQQYLTARARLRLDLYERRFRVYDAIERFLAHILAEADPSLEAIRDLSIGTSEAPFLFDQDVLDYISQLRDRAITLRRQNKDLAPDRLPLGPERTKLAEDNSALLKWFGDQIQDARPVFRRYLSFHNIS